MDHDIIIVGGGPAGLSFARSLAGSGLRILLLESQPEAALEEPAYDGREIALTHRSVRLLAELGAWQLIPAEGLSPLRTAKVLNGGSPLALTFDTGRSPQQELGFLVSNHLIRRSLFDLAREQDNLEIVCGTRVSGVSVDGGGASVRLDGGRTVTARLLVAADSRFSTTRSQLGIAAEMNPLGRAMLCCRVDHDRDHGHVATEWFDRDHTIAMLPLNGRTSSAVITLPEARARALSEMDDHSLGRRIAELYRHRLGAMRVASTRHVYPLVTSWARRFAIPGAALIGDTAVGMHPVTAHGFNLGLSGQALLAREIIGALRRGEDWASTEALCRFERAHRRAARPLYSGTNAIVRLYNDPRPTAWAVRQLAIRAGRRLPFARTAVRSMLLQA